MHGVTSSFLSLWPLFLIIGLLYGLRELAPSRRRKARGRARAERSEEPTDDADISFRARPLLTNSETDFFRLLKASLPLHTVFAQVAMSALITPTRTRDQSAYYSARGRFAQKYVDFVVCEQRTLAVVAIVELDDPSHDGAEIADDRRDQMLMSAGYRVIRWDVRDQPNRNEIAQAIALA